PPRRAAGPHRRCRTSGRLVRLIVGGHARLAVQPDAAQDDERRPREDPKVEPWAEPVDVPQVEVDPLAPCQVVAAGDLSETGDPGLRAEAAAIPGGVAGDLLGVRRSRTDDAHVATHHVQDLWKLVEAPPPQECADARDPWIVRRRERPSTMPGRMKAVLIGAGGHARVVLDAARAAKRIDIVCVIDADPAKRGTRFEDLDVIGDESVLPGLRARAIDAIVLGVGSV